MSGDGTFTRADGRTLTYRQSGVAAGPVVFYFHGSPTSRLDLSVAGTADSLEARGVRAVAVDRPGYGGSSPQPNRTFEHWARDVEALADHLGVGRYAVVGYSGGGNHALACAAYSPERVTACGVIAGVTDMAWPGAWTGFAEHEHAAFRLDNEAAVVRWCAERYGPDGMGLLTGDDEWTPADIAFMNDERIGPALGATLREGLRQGVGGYAQDAFVQSRPWPFEPGAITAPCHFLHGALDTVVPVAHSRHTVGLVPHAELRVLPAHGHVSIWAELANFAASVAVSS